MESKRESISKKPLCLKMTVGTCQHAEFQRVIPGLFEGGLAVTSVTTMAARVGCDKFLLHVLSLREGSS